MESTPQNGGSQAGSQPGREAAGATGTEGNGGTQQRGRSGQRSQTAQSPAQQAGRQPGRSVAAAQRGGRELAMARQQQQSPMGLFLQLSRDMDRLMDSFFGRGASPFGLPLESGTGQTPLDLATEWVPRIDVQQRDDAIVVYADLPGVRGEDVNIEITDDGIAISGERMEEREEGDERQGYRLVERSYGTFYRLIPLPENANTDQVRANMRNGVLEIVIPTQTSQRRRQIRVEDKSDRSERDRSR